MGSPGMPPRNGPMSPQGAFGRPLPKTYQAGNLIPNKSTMVEDDDDGLGDDSDHEGAFGLEDRRSNGMNSMNGRAGMKRDSNRSMSSLRNGVGAGSEVRFNFFFSPPFFTGWLWVGRGSCARSTS